MSSLDSLANPKSGQVLVSDKDANKFSHEYENDEKEPLYTTDSSSTGGISDAIDFTHADIDAIVPIEDYDVPANTLRMWVLSIVLSAVIGGVDSFFQMRFPTIHIGAIVAQVISYPIGELWYFVVPQWTVPLPWNMSFSLNPGPFNQKEHACIYLFTNYVVSAGLVNNVVVEQFKFFNNDISIGRMILFNMASFLMAWCLSGLTRSILVTNADSTWPGVLSTCALFKAFHSRENEPAGSWTISRFKFFAIVFAVSFVWYWFPDLILPFVSTLGAWISWCKPSSAALSQVFGVKTGLGLFPLTLDWTQVTSLSNPLTTPMWSVLCVFVSFVFWIWSVMPGLYYTNKWQTAHLPIMTASVYDYKGKAYNATKVIDKHWRLDVAKFEKYSPVMLPIAFLMNLALGLAAFAAMMVSFVFRFKIDVWDAIRSPKADVHNRALAHYKDLHWLWYIASGVIALGLGFAFSGRWNDTQIQPDGYIVSVILGAALFVPLALIESKSNFEVSLASFFEIVSAFWFKGQPITLMYFYTMGFGTLQHAMHCSMGAKIGHYMKVPPKTTMIVLFAGSVWGALVSPSVSGFILEHFKRICTAKAENHMICRKTHTQYNTHLVWGLFGTHLFAHGGRYHWVLWFFLAGGLTGLVISLIQLWKPRNSIIKKINPTLLFGGAASIPSVTGFNYSTWFLVAFILNFYIHRRHHAWWKKYNLVLAVGLDCGVAIAAILIYFCVVYTGGAAHYSWWGTNVSKTGCDATGCPHLLGPMTRPSGW